MGLQFKELVVKEELVVKDLKDKILAVDSLNLLYQFLTTIRGVDGSVLTDSKGRVTSHLIGLFNRTTSLMEEGLKLVFVFDGKPPEIKQKTWEKRKAVKKEATLRLKEAEEAGDLEEMRRQASRTAVLNKDMIEDAKRIITTLGLPIVQAPSEGEAQTAYMVTTGDAFASVSQDYDNLIFGCPRLIRNLSIAGKRKKTGKLGFVTVKPELILLDDVLENLKITREQLIVLAILVGTDYNPGGVKGIGPKKGLKLVQAHKDDFDALFKEVKWDEEYDIPWKKIYDTIKDIPVTDDYSLEWKKIDEEKLFTLLVKEHDFSEERVRSKLEKLQEVQKKGTQKGLGSFF
ncbi:flap endonuclease-1 [Candidatus Woesearchaeota archaeon CG10_big_fil_rev_8_21_14_0_10_45_16]|nr:MAG: flap endonuclease-1 [Candidatus Woesearchaeota archaeon CG10_big_fil_rev_8_21_14_0_10_45_16]